jgi:hypothetical protein
VSFTNLYWFAGHAAKCPYLALINSRVACTGMLGTGTYVIAIFNKKLLGRGLCNCDENIIVRK